MWHHHRYASGAYGNNFWLDAWGTSRTRAASTSSSRGTITSASATRQSGDDQAAADGFRQFVLGTGGAGLNKTFQDRPNREVLIRDHGITVFELGDGSYSWEFRDHQTNAVDDSGSDTCVTPPDPVPTG